MLYRAEPPPKRDTAARSPALDSSPSISPVAYAPAEPAALPVAAVATSTRRFRRLAVAATLFVIPAAGLTFFALAQGSSSATQAHADSRATSRERAAQDDKDARPEANQAATLDLAVVIAQQELVRASAAAQLAAQAPSAEPSSADDANPETDKPVDAPETAKPETAKSEPHTSSSSAKATNTSATRGADSKSKPHAQAGATSTSGGLPPEVIQRVVRQSNGRFRMCYESALRSDPKLKGRVAVSFAISRDGSVSGVSASGDLPSKVNSCIAGAFRTLSFPKPDSVVRVTYPIQFSPGK